MRPALAAHDNPHPADPGDRAEAATDDTGRTVTGVVTTMADGSTETFAAHIVVVSAGSILSSVLLLKSANDKHPNGLANSSDASDGTICGKTTSP